VKKSAKQAFLLFEQDASHPGLRFKKLQARDDLWSVRISDQYRAVGIREGDSIEWIWIGSHNDFDNQFS
jgi:hypothetical protein